MLPESNAFFFAAIDDKISEMSGKVLSEERFNRAEMPSKLQIRYWQPGDFMIPFGGKFHKKLQDLFTDAQIPCDQRFRLPLLLADNQIIWLPTVRRAEFARTMPGKPQMSIQYGICFENSNKHGR